MHARAAVALALFLIATHHGACARLIPTLTSLPAQRTVTVGEQQRLQFSEPPNAGSIVSVAASSAWWLDGLQVCTHVPDR